MKIEQTLHMQYQIENMLEQLRLAMASQPSLSMLQVINEALDMKFATRTMKYNENQILISNNQYEKWKPTNYDIYWALVIYNKVRHENIHGQV